MRVLRVLLIFLLLIALPARGTGDPAALNAEGLAHFQAGRLEEAFRSFEEALLQAPDETAIRENLGLTLNQLAVGLAREDRKAEALFYFEKLRDLRLQRGAYLLNYGRVLTAMGEGERALWVFQEALERELSDEEKGQTLFAMADAYATESLHEESIGILHRLLDEYPGYPGSSFLLGLNYYRLGQLEKAAGWLEKSRDQDPENLAGTARELLAKLQREASVEQGFQTQSDRHFLIQFDGERVDEVLEPVRELLDEAYRTLGRRFNGYPEGQLPVIIYTGQQFRQASASPHWAAAVYDGKIRLPVGRLHELGPRLKALLFHEYTHCLVHELAAGKCPAWLNEGLAQIMEGREVDAALGERVGRAVRDGRLLRLEGLRETFVRLPEAELVTLAYDQSFLLTRWIIEERGLYTLLEAFERMRREDKGGPEILAEALFKDEDRLLADFARTYKP